MSLVQYGSDSEGDSGDEGPTPSVAPAPAPIAPSASASRRTGLFASLPPPKSGSSSAITEDKEPTKKRKAPIVFTVPVPAKSDSEDEEDVVAPKRAKTGASGSGLFSLLPAPKSGADSYMTAGKRAEVDAVDDSKSEKQIEGKEPPKPKTTASLMPYSLQKKQQGAKKTKQTSDDEDDEDDHSVSFMKSLSAPNKAAESVTARYNSSNYCADSVSEPSQPPISSYPASETLHSDEGAIGPYPDYSNQGYDDDVTGDYPVTDDAYSYGAYEQQQQQQSVQYAPVTQRDLHTIHALEGKRGRRDDLQDMNILEVNAAVEIGNTAAWRQQYGDSQPAAPGMSEASKKHDKNMSGGAKRKHQITYLAAQAKAQQTELEQRWSSNRMTKRQTQAKYGF